MGTSTVTTVTSQYTNMVAFNAPTIRARTIVIACKKLKPFTAMNVYFSNANVNSYYTPCRMIQITATNVFLDHTLDQQTDNLTQRTTAINSYDTIKCGEVITCSTGSAVVISDETIYDSVSASNKRILYVANVKGTISGQITGSITNSIATVVASVAGTSTSNSMGNLYGYLTIPAMTFAGGNNSVMVTDAASADPFAATTTASAGFITNGVIDSFTTTINQTSQVQTTIGGGGGPGFLGIFGSGSFFGF